MKSRRLGRNGPAVSDLGLGCMGMSEFYGTSDDATSRTVIRLALEKGMTLLDTADMYGHGHNEQLVGSVLKEWSGEVFVATKFGIVRQPGSHERSVNGRPEYVKTAVEASLQRLGRDVIDLYYLHRIDPQVPIEDTVGTMADLVHAGKVRFIGLSEVSAATIRRAHAIHPLTAVQTEYSLWSRNVEAEVLPVCDELGIGFVAYSPLGRGFLTGKLGSADQLEDGDFRRVAPRFVGQNFDHNQHLVTGLAAIAAEKGVTPAQLGLAWLLAKHPHVVPIPGTRRQTYLLENIAAADILLSGEDMERIESVIPPGAVQGARYPEAGMKGVEE